MSWSDVDTTGISVVESDSESRRFQRRVVRVTMGLRWPEQFATEAGAVDALRDVVLDQTAELAIVRAPTELSGLGAALTRAAQQVHAAGTLLYWEAGSADLALPLAASAASETVFAAEAPAALREAVADVIHEIFDDYRNHYRYNPTLGARVVTDGYREWAAGRFTSASGIFGVVRQGDELIAAASARLVGDDNDMVEVELAGVRQGFRRSGHYRVLLRSIGDFARRHGATRITISTQAANVGVQRVWADEGFRPTAAIDTFHVSGAGRTGLP